jgi:hypothetical protein
VETSVDASVDGDDSDSTRLLVDPSSAPSDSSKFYLFKKKEKQMYFFFHIAVLSYVICQAKERGSLFLFRYYYYYYHYCYYFVPVLSSVSSREESVCVFKPRMRNVNAREENENLNGRRGKNAGQSSWFPRDARKRRLSI